MAEIRAYLAGPMTGLPDYNQAGFAEAAAWAARQGWTPVNPHDTDPTHAGPCPPGERHKGHPNDCWYAASIRVLMSCERIVLLPGWSQSIGANRELSAALGAGLTVDYYLPPEPPLSVTESPDGGDDQ